jgi:uncharacterized membrane protein YvbJ
MKYCTSCGKEIMDEAVICPHCGCATGKVALDAKNEEVTEYANKAWTFALIGLFFFVFSIPALVYASKSKSKNGDTYTKKAKEAFITAIIELILWSLVIMLWGL